MVFVIQFFTSKSFYFKNEKTPSHIYMSFTIIFSPMIDKLRNSEYPCRFEVAIFVISFWRLTSNNIMVPIVTEVLTRDDY